MAILINTLTIVLISVGIIFFFGAVVGVLRFPDFYSRTHAAGKGDTLSALLILAGFATYNLHDFSWLKLLVSLKMGFICLFIYTTSPTATHALVNAGYKADDVEPWLKPKASEEEQA